MKSILKIGEDIQIMVGPIRSKTYEEDKLLEKELNTELNTFIHGNFIDLKVCEVAEPVLEL